MKRLIILLLFMAVVGVSLSGFSPPDSEQPPKDEPVELGDGQWKELADADAAKAYQTILKMVDDPVKAVPYLRDRLLAEPLPTPQEVATLIADLNSSSFAKREAASRALERLGPSAELTLIRRLDDKNSQEMQQRIEQILKKLEARRATVVELRVGRALEVLERIGNAEAKQALNELVKDHAERWLGEEARKGLARLHGHPEFGKMPLEKKAPDANDDSVPHGSRQFPYRFAAISPDGKQALVTEEFDRVFLWDLVDGTVIRELPSNMACGAVAWAPNGKLAASGRYTGEIDVWDAKSWELLRTLPGHPRSKPGAYGVEVAVFHLQFSADCQQLISAGGAPTYPRSIAGSLCHWDVTSGKLIRRHFFPDGIARTEAVSSDGEFIAFLRARARLGRFQEPPDFVVWNLARGKQVIAFSGNELPIARTATFTSSGRFVLIGQSGGSTLLETASAQPVTGWKWPSRGSTAKTAISPAARLALCTDGTGSIMLFDLYKGEHLNELSPPHAPGTLDMLFSPDGGQVLSLSDKNVLVLWDLAKVGKNRTLAGPYDDLQSAPYCAYFFPPEDQQPIMAKGARKMKVLGDEAGVERPITILFSADSGPRVFTADAKWLFSSHGLVDVEMGNIAWSAFPGGESGNLVLPTVRHSHCVAISPDGSFGLSGGSPTARPLSLWDLKKGKLAAELAGHKGHVRSVALSRDGKFALSRGDDKFIKLWQVPSGKPLKSFEDPGGAFSEVSFSPDDKLMFSRGTTITAWETATGKLVRSIERPAKEVRHFAYSADGTLGLSGIMDNAVTLWDMKSGKVIRKLNPPDGVPTPIHAVVISPDGKLAVALSGKMHAWNLKTGKLLEVSLRRAANLDLPASRLA